MTVVIAFGMQTTANAQLGGLLNKAKDAASQAATRAKNKVKNQVQDQVEQTKTKTKNKIKTKALSKVVSKAFGKEPECPEIMKLDRYGNHGNELYEKLYSFRFASEDEAKDYGGKLTARYLWGKKVLENMGSDKIIPFDSGLFNQLDSEQAMFTTFYGNIYHLLSLYSPVQMKKDSRAENLWYYEGSPTFMTQFSQTGVPSSEKGIRPANNSKGDRICFKKNKANKYVFIDASGNSRFLEDDEMEVAKNEQRFVKNMALLLEELAKVDEDYMKKYQAAIAFSIAINEALSGNSVDNIEYKPMPKAGKLNASLKAKALAIAKSRNSDVVDVVITRNAWDIKRNALGVPTHRVAYGYYIVKTKHGKRALPYSWAQDHQGGGKYGALRHFGVGVGGQFFVK